MRSVSYQGRQWFLIADICGALEIKGPADAAKRLDDDEKTLIRVQTAGGPQQVVCVTESGAYHLSFVSRKPIAKRFRRWITEEVIPCIRETGFYALPGGSSENLEDQQHLKGRFQAPGRYVVLSLPNAPLVIEARDMDEILLDFDQADIQALVSSAKLVGSLWRSYRAETAILNEPLTLDEGLQQLDQAISLSTRLAQWVQRVSENKALALAKAATE
ncbi:BRO-N domain-containing protein [Gluconobacter albidus]|uniref:BRO-N domain-containing protein n=1 Tax=Gluconobacter albidus TaxID=318683 RepID=UPI00263F7AC1|nr:Bro-N domain-containing protein [Gluconobacter albidus]